MDLETAALATVTAHRVRRQVVPVDDGQIRLLLRAMGHPITLFGEDKAARRDRLKAVVVERQDSGLDPISLDDLTEYGTAAPRSTAAPAQEVTELFYTPASPDLIAARVRVAPESFARADRRLKRQRADRAADPREADLHAARLFANTKAMRASATQIGDDRPLTCVAVNATHIATSGWGGDVKLWSYPACEPVKTWKGHTERTTGVAFIPDAATDKPMVVSGGADDTVRLWSLASDAPAATLSGHVSRIGKVAAHPFGGLVASSSYDKTWRLWDVEKEECVLLQEGHSKQVYPIAFHPDGSLVATGDLGGILRVWDIRTAKTVFTLKAHAGQILGMDWSPNGYHLATGSDDNTSLIVDLRQRRSVYTILAHSNLLSQVQFSPSSGESLTTVSFDRKLKIWSTRDWAPVASHVAHEAKVSGVAVSPDDMHIVTCAFDRTFKLWGAPDFVL